MQGAWHSEYLISCSYYYEVIYVIRMIHNTESKVYARKRKQDASVGAGVTEPVGGRITKG